MKLFAQSRGYSVATNYNQYIYGYRGNTQGFTYDQYKAEIDAGYPVLIQVEGHTMLGVGYTGTDQIIVHDTWDYTKHTMTWGGMYANMRHYGVGVFHLNPPPAPTPTPTPTPVPAPVVTSITPDSGQIGTRVLYTLTGSHFAAGARVNLSKTGERNISDMPTLVGTNLTGVFAIPEDATLGQWNVTVQQNGQYSNDDVIFTITPPPVPVPEVFEVSPESGQAGLCVPYVVTGSGFVDGAFVHLTREGEVNITSSARLDGGKLNGTFKIPLSARNGPWHVLVEQDGHLSNDDVFFTITSAPLDIPIITSFMPFTGYRGEIITYTITGSHLLNGAIVNITHPGEPNISSIAMLDGDVLTGTFIIPVDARAGSWNVSVNQNGYLSADAIPFIITEGPTIAPVVHNITPPSGIQGDMINYLIQGEYFMDGAKVVFSHPDQAVISSSADLTDGNLTGTVHIPDDAFPGAWNVTIHQGNLSSNDDVQFLILPSGPYPVVHSITMSFAALGKGTGFIVFGENFEDGAIVNLSHPKEKNITAIGSLVDGTLTGTFHIPEYCSSGLWNVTVNVQGRISNDEVQYPIKGKTQ